MSATVADTRNFRLLAAFPVAISQVWNGLPEAVVSSSSLRTFRRRLQTHLLQLSYHHLIF